MLDQQLPDFNCASYDLRVSCRNETRDSLFCCTSVRSFFPPNRLLCDTSNTESFCDYPPRHSQCVFQEHTSASQTSNNTRLRHISTLRSITPSYFTQFNLRRTSPSHPSFKMTMVVKQDWHHKGSECCTPLSSCCLSWWCPCIIYGRTTHRRKNNGSLENHSAFNGSVRSMLSSLPSSILTPQPVPSLLRPCLSRRPLRPAHACPRRHARKVPSQGQRVQRLLVCVLLLAMRPDAAG